MNDAQPDMDSRGLDVNGHLTAEECFAAEAENERLLRALNKIEHEAVDAPHARQIARDARDADHR